MKADELLYIEETALSLSDWTIRHRRNLHRIPETGWQETETTEYLAEELKQMGYRVIRNAAEGTHTTGLAAELGTSPSPVIVLRFDIDALPVTETSDPSHFPSEKGFSSCHPGCMHACGHDGHMAIGLTAARILAGYRDQLKGTVRILFQPAEEGCRGAKELVSSGWLKDADYILAGHIVGREYGQTPQGPADCVTGVCGSLATTKLEVCFRGQSCHGACPENGASAITALCHSVLALNGIPRNSQGSTMINIGKISGGEGRNIVAAEASMELEVRGETTALNQYMEERAFSMIRASAAMHGCTSEIRITGKAPSLKSSDALHQRINHLMKQLPSVKIAERGERFRASEDAALLLDTVKEQGGQGVFLLFPTDTTAPLHSCNYDFDEQILTKAAIVFSCITLDLLL